MSDLVHKLAFSRLHGMNVSLGESILSRIGGDPQQFFSMTASQLAAVMGFDSKLFADDMRSRALREAGQEEAFVRANGITTHFFTGDNSGYPVRLRECDDAPSMIYALGECNLDGTCMIGIVGTRHATAYGTAFTDRLVTELANTLAERPVIVSGLAYGIDVAAHRAALAAGLPTVAVLAHGLNTIYPAAHRSYAAEIVKSDGALVTEYASSDAVHRGNFLARNRIVAGMCDCIVVVESDLKGGALVTARLANDYNREVFALPGRVNDRYSRGCNNLIARNMARIVSDINDIADTMNWKRKTVEGLQQELFSELDPVEQRIVDALMQAGEMRLSELQMSLNEQTHRLMGLLIDMELRGLVVSIPGNRYRLA